MEFKSILAPFVDEQSAKVGFEAAATMAKKDKAHISCIHIRQRPIPATTVIYPLGGVYTEFTENFQETENKLAADLKQSFFTLCTDNKISVTAPNDYEKGKGVTASWRDEEGDLLSAVTLRGAACDLSIVAAIGESVSPQAKLVAEELLFQSGRPVLLCPRVGLGSEPKRIVVAWNGRAEAARAVASALGLLKAAESVKVLTVRKAEAPAINTDQITTNLRLHDVDASQTEIELADGENETERLDEEIAEFNADLLVMGAYSHNRWREAILGGFTRHILRQSPIAVLLSQ